MQNYSRIIKYFLCSGGFSIQQWPFSDRGQVGLPGTQTSARSISVQLYHSGMAHNHLVICLIARFFFPVCSLQVPGQSVALHLDAVYFERATRFQYPMWLLAVMQTSGLYQNEFIDQVQVGFRLFCTLPNLRHCETWESQKFPDLQFVIDVVCGSGGWISARVEQHRARRKVYALEWVRFDSLFSLTRLLCM